MRLLAGMGCDKRAQRDAVSHFDRVKLAFVCLRYRLIMYYKGVLLMDAGSLVGEVEGARPDRVTSENTKFIMHERTVGLQPLSAIWVPHKDGDGGVKEPMKRGAYLHRKSIDDHFDIDPTLFSGNECCHHIAMSEGVDADVDHFVLFVNHLDELLF